MLPNNILWLCLYQSLSPFPACKIKCLFMRSFIICLSFSPSFSFLRFCLLLYSSFSICLSVSYSLSLGLSANVPVVPSMHLCTFYGVNSFLVLILILSFNYDPLCLSVCSYLSYLISYLCLSFSSICVFVAVFQMMYLCIFLFFFFI